MDDHPQYKGKLIIEFFPSRNELLNLINNHLMVKSYKKDYRIINQDSKMIITFNNSDVAYEISCRLIHEQSINPIFIKMTIAMVIIPSTDLFIKIKHVSQSQEIKNRTPIAKIGKRLMHEEKMKLQKYKGRRMIKESGLLSSSPYASVEDVYIQDMKINKSKWLNEKGFIVAAPKLKTSISNYVRASPSPSPLNHQFKPVAKRKWVSEDDFKLR